LYSLIIEEAGKEAPRLRSYFSSTSTDWYRYLFVSKTCRQERTCKGHSARWNTLLPVFHVDIKQHVALTGW